MSSRGSARKSNAPPAMASRAHSSSVGSLMSYGHGSEGSVVDSPIDIISFLVQDQTTDWGMRTLVGARPSWPPRFGHAGGGQDGRAPTIGPTIFPMTCRGSALEVHRTPY